MRGEVGYTPLDDLLRQPAVRLLRLLRRFDWIETRDIWLGLDFADRAHAEHEAYTQALCRLHKDHCVERIGRLNGYSYRITELGHERLAKYLRRADLRPMTQREMSLDDGVW